MKIISGKYKGRVLKGFDINGTRPTMDRVKESVFAMIQDYIKDSIVLDLYAGSGNLAIEAISNGAKKVYLVDNNKIAINTIKDNIKMLNINNAVIVQSNANNALNNFINDNVAFGVIFLDPPYNTNELDKSLSKINDNLSLLSDDGIVVCETSIQIDYAKYNNLVIYKTRRYGQKEVTILRKLERNL
jgi:16S rRNA (guanine966-N2)-methyltransferase